VYKIDMTFKDEFMKYVDIDTYSIHYRLFEKHGILKFDSV